MKFLFVLPLVVAAVVAAGDHDDHDHGDEEHHGHAKCVCEAQVLGFTIDCTDTAAMKDAMLRLQSGGCATNCESESCEKDWMIVQSHHDHCPEAGIPIEVEMGFHDYDEVCHSCDIVRQEIPGAPVCPTVNCNDGSGNMAYQRLLAKGCNLQFQCTEANCKDDWLTLRVVHDTCDHDALSQAAEEGLHILEEPCADFQCNLPAAVIADSMICTAEELKELEEEHAEHHHEESPTTAPADANTADSGVGNKFTSGFAIASMGIAASLW